MIDFSTADLSADAIIAEGVVPSTNDLAVEAARAGAAHGWAVRAKVQTAGRGRRGHSWASPEGSLYLSIVLRPQVPMHMFMGLPAVTSLGVLNALEGMGLSGRVGVKWPNDIVAAPAGIASPRSAQINRKLVGILVEGRSSDAGPFAVAGIGLNIIALRDAPPAPPEVQAAIDAAASVRRAAGEGDEGRAIPALEPISLAEALPANVPLPGAQELAQTVRDAVVDRVARWERAIAAGLGAQGPLAPIITSYHERLPMLGRPVNVLDIQGRVLATGYFEGVDPWGRARVSLGSGKVELFSAEMVSLREV